MADRIVVMPHPLEIGVFHDLRVVNIVDGGVLLDGGGVDLFLPSHLCPDDVALDTVIEVFVYVDHDGAPQATTHEPSATVGEFAYLKCVSVTRAGAYLDWGVPKDLYAPPDEQTTPMVEGQRYVVAICLDRKGERLIASTHLTKHFDYDVSALVVDQAVELLVYAHSELGAHVVVDRCHRGLIHSSEVHGFLPIGSTQRGFVRVIRDDNRLDIVLSRRGLAGMKDAERKILAALERAGGSLALHDGSTPEQIERALGLSKKAFKRGVGRLYKARRITIGDGSIALVNESGA